MILEESRSDQEEEKKEEEVEAGIRTSSGSETEGRRSRFEFTRQTILIFMFVVVRGPLFRVEDLIELGWNRVYAWRAVNSLVKAGILEKFDRKSYGITKDARSWFRIAFGGGVNDAAFAYSTMAVETWSETRLNRFKEKLSEIWEERPDRIKQDPARTGLTSASDDEEDGDDYCAIAKLMCEKIEEASYLAATLKRRQHQSQLSK